MSTYGLQIWDKDENSILDTDFRITRLILEFSISPAEGTTQVVSVPGATTDGTWVAHVEAPGVYATIVAGGVSIFRANHFPPPGTITVLILRY